MNYIKAELEKMKDEWNTSESGKGLTILILLLLFLLVVIRLALLQLGDRLEQNLNRIIFFYKFIFFYESKTWN